MVLSAPVTGNNQPVLMKLQHTFAFLQHTLRALYSPSDFLKAARPPWFESGRQQDCSEFLRYLLDTLQEQEKIKGVIMREHRVIEPPAKQNSTTSDQEAMEIVKSSTSVNALDAISEEAPEDVDMQDQDFVFGSRSSLQKRDSGDDDSDNDDDDDMHGSRNSLSGLKRWTTEENLFINDPRGSRSELMETPLHDSHSNSTGKYLSSSVVH